MYTNMPLMVIITPVHLPLFGQINTLLEGRKNCAADEIYQ